MSEPTVLMKGLGIPESPRWHEGRLMTGDRLRRQEPEGSTPNLERLTSGPRTGEILTLPVSVPGAGRP
jgi:hypothetical protein